MRYGSKVAVVMVTAFTGLGLSACDEDQSLPALNLTGVHVQALNGPSSWPQDGVGMAGPLAVVAELSTPFKGRCTLRIPASPIDSRDARTQILVPLTTIAVYQMGDYPTGVDPAPVSGDPAILELDVTSAASVGGVVTSGTALYDHNQTTLETHTNWTSTLDCPDRENSGTVTVNFH